MGRGVVVLLAAVGAVAGGCGQASTGVHVYAHTDDQPYDELRFGVVLLPPLGSALPTRTIVDPATRGRYAGPFRSDGDQDVVIYLGDDIAEQNVSCDAVALLGGAVVASGAAQVMVQSQQIVGVDVFLSPAGPPATVETPPSSPPPPPDMSPPPTM